MLNIIPGPIEGIGLTIIFLLDFFSLTWVSPGLFRRGPSATAPPCKVLLFKSTSPGSLSSPLKTALEVLSDAFLVRCWGS